MVSLEALGNSLMSTPQMPRIEVPRAPIDRIVKPIQRFMVAESAGGVLLVLSAALALVIANSRWGHSYQHFFHLRVGIGTAESNLTQSVEVWINDLLMAVFFLLVGLEIKREILVGELSTWRKAALPCAGALGGMIVPALIFTGVAWGSEYSHGWAIPMATDIAFALGVLSLLGSRVPFGLRVFLAALAVVDDLGAILVIAFFYSTGINLDYLALAACTFAAMGVCNLLGVRSILVYLLLGAVLWYAVLHSGVHATIAGVLTALMVPARSSVSGRRLLVETERLLEDTLTEDLNDVPEVPGLKHQEVIERLREVARVGSSPLQHLIHVLHPWVNFMIMPLFAFANSGVAFSADMASNVTHPAATGAFLGLLFGKQVGIFLFSFGAVALGLAQRPSGTTLRQLYGVACLGGIGFTMSLFIANLSFGGSATLDISKLGILAGSIASGALGITVLATAKTSSPPRKLFHLTSG